MRRAVGGVISGQGGRLTGWRVVDEGLRSNAKQRAEREKEWKEGDVTVREEKV